MYIIQGFRAVTIAVSITIFTHLLFSTPFLVEPLSARSYCDAVWLTQPDPDEVVWLPWRTYCDRFQTMSSNPSYFLVDDYPAEDLPDCKELGTAWYIEKESSQIGCEVVPSSGYLTEIPYELPIGCNGNTSMPVRHYYIGAKLEFYGQDFDIYCPGYPMQSWFSNVALKYFVREPVGPDEAIAGKNRGNPSCGLAAGNPVNIATGNKFHDQQDAQLPEGLGISRYYNSSDTAVHSFGRSWRGNYSRSIETVFSGDQSSASLTLISDDGTENYWRIENGVPVPPPDASRKLDVAYDNGQVLGFTVVGKDGTIETYDVTGRLLSLENGSGHALSFTYVDNRLVTATTSSGRTLDYSYLPGGRVDRISSTSGSTWKYLYDDNDNLSQVEFPDGTFKTYHYENVLFPHALTGVTDENGNRTRSWAYDDSGRAVLSTHGDPQSPVERHTISYNPDGTTTTSGPLELSVDHSFKARHGALKPGTTSKACSGCGNSTKSTTYDERGNRDLVTDFAGNINDYDHTPGNLVQKVTYAAGAPQQHEVNLSWDENLRKPTRIATENQTTRYTYNSRGQVLTRSETDNTSGASRNWTYTYFEAPALPPLVGKLQSLDGPRTDVADLTRYEYYTSNHAGGDYRVGDLSAVVNPFGHRTEYLKYDGDGRLLEVSDPNGVITSIAYHPRGWVLSTTVDGNTTRFTHDPAGNLTGHTQPDGSHVSYQYDPYHRLTAIADTLGNRIDYQLDNAGNQTAEHISDSQGNLRRQLGRVYDSLNQLVAISDGTSGQTRYEYDANGNRISITDANLNTSHYEYDALNRLVKMIDPILGETSMTYDSSGNPTHVADPLGGLTQYVHDGLGNQIAVESPDTGLTFHDYDEAGNRIATTDARGVRTEFTYDAMNRLLQVSYPDSTLNVNYGYDEGPGGKGYLTSMSDAAGTVAYAYDRRGNLLSETRVMNGEQFITSFAYNPSNRLVQISYPSGMVVDYELDAAGQVISISKNDDSGTEILIDNVMYAPFGPATSFIYGNGSGYSRTLNLDYEPTNLESGPGLNWSISHDSMGNILAITDQVDSQKSQVFTYDELYRLKSARGDYGSESFAYDANSNRTGFTDEWADDLYAYEPQSNRLLTQGAWNFTRDPGGNRIEKVNSTGSDQQYEFGDHSRLSKTSVRNSSGNFTVGDYSYDGRGQRVSKSTNGEITYFVYGLSGELLGEYSNQESRTSREYVYLDAQPIAVITRKFELTRPQGKELIQDNGDPGTSSTGAWKTLSGSGSHGGDYLFAGKSSDRSYRWTATPPGNQYEVYAWWVDKKKHSDRVDYTIRYGAGETETVTVSQREGGSQWQLLGAYHSTDGQDYVEVTSRDNKFVADAIRWLEITEPVVTETETTDFIHFDHLGTPRRVTDRNQTVIWSWDSTPFGQSVPDQDPDGDLQDYILNLRFPGQYFDEESGLHYNYYRTYDPDTGRYIESDPIGLTGGLSTFGYAAGNPILLVDPLGLIIKGNWLKDPKFNITDYGLTEIKAIAPYINGWGFLKALGVSGYASGFVNVDIQCSNSDGCDSEEWEIHMQLPLSFNGSADFGPNILAVGTGYFAGPLAGAAVGILTFSTSSLSALLGLLQKAKTFGGERVQWIYGIGPDAICRGFQ